MFLFLYFEAIFFTISNTMAHFKFAKGDEAQVRSLVWTVVLTIDDRYWWYSGY